MGHYLFSFPLIQKCHHFFLNFPSFLAVSVCKDSYLQVEGIFYFGLNICVEGGLVFFLWLTDIPLSQTPRHHSATPDWTSTCKVIVLKLAKLTMKAFISPISPQTTVKCGLFFLLILFIFNDNHGVVTPLCDVVNLKVVQCGLWVGVCSSTVVQF